MIGTLQEMNWIIAVVVFLLGLMMIPMLLDRNAYVPRKTSVATSAALAIITFAFIDIGLIESGISELIATIIWIGVIIWRGGKNGK